MNLTEQSILKTILYLIGSISLLIALVYTLKSFALKKYRLKISEYHDRILKYDIPENTYLLVTYDTDTNKNVGFVPCTIVHIYPYKKMVNVVFKKNNAPFSRSISKDVAINLIYPEWAVPKNNR